MIGGTCGGIFGVGQHSGISSVLDFAVNGYDNGFGIFGSIGYGVLDSGHGMGYTHSGFGDGNRDTNSSTACRGFYSEPLGTGTFRPSETAR
jgi:hypothetical protein